MQALERGWIGVFSLWEQIADTQNLSFKRLKIVELLLILNMLKKPPKDIKKPLGNGKFKKDNQAGKKSKT